MEASGAVFLHPYNDPRVMAGQGTMALELLEQVSQSEPSLVPSPPTFCRVFYGAQGFLCCRRSKASML